MPRGNPMGYLPPEVQRQLLGAAMAAPFMGGGGVGLLASPLFGGAPAAPAPMSFMGSSVPMQGRRMADFSIQELNELLLDPRVKGDQERKNKISRLIQKKQLGN